MSWEDRVTEFHLKPGVRRLPAPSFFVIGALFGLAFALLAMALFAPGDAHAETARTCGAGARTCATANAVTHRVLLVARPGLFPRASTSGSAGTAHRPRVRSTARPSHRRVPVRADAILDAALAR